MGSPASVPPVRSVEHADTEALQSRIRDLELLLASKSAELQRLKIAELILHRSEDLVFALDKNLCFVYANPTTVHLGTIILQCTEEEFSALSLPDIARNKALAGSDFEGNEFKGILSIFQTATSLYLESNVIHEGRLIWLGAWFFPVSDERGEVTAVVGMARNITAQRETQAALAAEKERLAVTLAAVADAVITTDTKGTIMSFNASAEKLTGRRATQAVGLFIEDVLLLIRESDRTRAENPVTALLAAEDRRSLYREDMDVILVAQNSRETLISSTTALILQDNRECIGAVLVLRDVSKQRAAEEEMHRIQKLEAVGILAGGIAHDFNNIMTSVMGNISLAQRKKNDDFLFARLKDAEKAVTRAQGLTNQLLTFSKGGAPIKTSASIQRIIEDSAAFSLIGSSVKRAVHIPDDLWRVEVDEGQISQVIQNLVINADQAMPNGGTVYISAENRLVGPEHGLPLPPGQYVMISVADEGIGIPACNLDRVFDPYFTTKENGTGLGLATTHSIIRRHGGHITVESKEGSGTCFSVYLKATEERVSGEFSSLYIPFVGRGRILVMDDESTIRDVVRVMLKDLGFEVESAADGKDAVALYLQRRKEGRPFDAVIMDLTVPGGLGGKEALAHLKNVDSDAKVIVSSGYSNDPVMSEYKSYGFAGRVTKPYGMDQLTNVLRKVIGVKSGR